MAKIAETSGYSLLEVMMAVSVSVIGLVSLLALFSQSVVTIFLVQEELIAKQKAQETMESIYTARNTQVSFADIETINDGGIFSDGFQPLKVAGNDGLIGTGDDGAVEMLLLPGPDGLLGNGDDINRTLSNFERQIQIDTVLDAASNPYPDLKQVTIIVRYTTPQGWQRSFQASSYVSRYR
jgi:type II secretory pathway pseudopilin PulG